MMRYEPLVPHIEYILNDQKLFGPAARIKQTHVRVFYSK